MPRANPLFVRLDYPARIKKSIIESAVDSVVLLREHERLKLTERQIESLTARFISTIRNIERQIDSLNSLMPRVSMPGKLDIMQPTTYAEPSQPIEQEDYTVDTAETSLEDELKNIEEQLKNIV